MKKKVMSKHKIIWGREFQVHLQSGEGYVAQGES